jgi:hypothetical protein
MSWSTPESEIPTPLAQRITEPMDALEEVRDSQEANAAAAAATTKVGDLLFSNGAAFMISVSDNDNDSSQDYGTSESWVEFTPEQRTSHTKDKTSCSSDVMVNTTADTSSCISDELLTVTLLTKQVKSQHAVVKRKSMESSDSESSLPESERLLAASVTSLPEEDHRGHSSDSPAVAKDSPANESSCTQQQRTATSPSSDIAGSEDITPPPPPPTTTTSTPQEESMRKRALLWFQTRNKEEKSSSNVTTTFRNKNNPTNDIPVQQDIVGGVVVETHDEVVTTFSNEATSVEQHVADDAGATTVLPNVSTKVVDSVPSPNKETAHDNGHADDVHQQDIVMVVEEDDTVIARVASVDSTHHSTARVTKAGTAVGVAPFEDEHQVRMDHGNNVEKMKKNGEEQQHVGAGLVDEGTCIVERDQMNCNRQDASTMVHDACKSMEQSNVDKSENKHEENELEAVDDGAAAVDAVASSVDSVNESIDGFVAAPTVPSEKEPKGPYSRTSIFRRLGSPRRRNAKHDLEGASIQANKENVTNESKHVSVSTAVGAAAETKAIEPENASGAASSGPMEKTDEATVGNELDGKEDEKKSGVGATDAAAGTALVGGAAAAGAIVANEPTDKKSFNEDKAQKNAKKKAARWFGLRRSNIEKGSTEKSLDETMEQDPQSPVAAKDEGLDETKGVEGLDAAKDEMAKAEDLTEFHLTNEFKEEAIASVGESTSPDEEDAIKDEATDKEEASAVVAIALSPKGDAKESGSPDGEVIIKDETNDQGEAPAAVAMAATTSAAAIGVAAVITPVVEGKGPSTDNEETQEALKKKASQWFGLRQSNSEKVTGKDLVKSVPIPVDSTDDAIGDSHQEVPVNKNVPKAGEWTDFDDAEINEFKAERSPDDALVAAAAVPLPIGGPEELHKADDEAEQSVVGTKSQDCQVAANATGVAAVGMALDGNDSAPSPFPDEIIEEYRDDDDEEAQLVQEEKKGQRGLFKCSRRSNIILIVLFHFMAICIVLGVLLPLVFSKRRDVVGSDTGVAPSPPPTTIVPNASPTTVATIAPFSYPTTVATAAPTFASVQQPLDVLLSSVSFDGGEALRTPFTAQAVAYNWLSNNSMLDSYSDEKRIQRYALATVFYSMNGDVWGNNTGWVTDSDECDWFNTALGGFCNSEGVVVEFDIMYNELEGTIPDEIALLPFRK